MSLLPTGCMDFCLVRCVFRCCRFSDPVRFIAEPAGRNLFALASCSIRKNTQCLQAGMQLKTLNTDKPQASLRQRFVVVVVVFETYVAASSALPFRADEVRSCERWSPTEPANDPATARILRRMVELSMGHFYNHAAHLKNHLTHSMCIIVAPPNSTLNILRECVAAVIKISGMKED